MTEKETLQCRGKEGFLTRAAAKRVVKAMRRRKRDRREPFDCYLCPHCGLWHIGSERPKRIRQPKRPETS